MFGQAQKNKKLKKTGPGVEESPAFKTNLSVNTGSIKHIYTNKKTKQNDIKKISGLSRDWTSQSADSDFFLLYPDSKSL